MNLILFLCRCNRAMSLAPVTLNGPRGLCSFSYFYSSSSCFGRGLLFLPDYSIAIFHYFQQANMKKLFAFLIFHSLRNKITQLFYRYIIRVN